ncbi:MAG: DUF111 family protein [Deltaproteobacteria bacterium]
MKSIKGNMWLVQADHLSGETLGVVIQNLFERGARNVQVIPTITKKNRPGHLIFIDVNRPRAEQGIEKYLFRELGILGYHVMPTRHVCEKTRLVEQTVHVRHGRDTATFKILLKVVGESGDGCYPRVEHDNVVELQQEIEKKFSRVLPLRELVSVVESAVHHNRQDVTIELNGSL